MAAMRVVVRYRTASLSYPVVGPRSCLRRPRPRSTPSPRVPRSRGARGVRHIAVPIKARGSPLARGAGAHGGACPPTPASRSSRRRRPGRPGPPRCAPAPRSAAGRGTGRTSSTRACSGPGAPLPGRPDPGALPHGVDHGAQRAAGARAAPTGHRPGHGGRMRPHPSSEAFAGIAIRFRTTRDAPRASPRPGPRARHLTREHVCQRYVLAGYPAISRVK